MPIPDLTPLPFMFSVSNHRNEQNAGAKAPGISRARTACLLGESAASSPRDDLREISHDVTLSPQRQVLPFSRAHSKLSRNHDVDLARASTPVKHTPGAMPRALAQELQGEGEPTW